MPSAKSVFWAAVGLTVLAVGLLAFGLSEAGGTCAFFAGLLYAGLGFGWLVKG